MLAAVSSILVPLALVAGLPFIDDLCRWYAGRMDRLRVARRRAGRCLSCGYDLTGNVSGRCPECGTHITGVAARRSGLEKLSD